LGGKRGEKELKRIQTCKCGGVTTKGARGGYLEGVIRGGWWRGDLEKGECGWC